MHEDTARSSPPRPPHSTNGGRLTLLMTGSPGVGKTTLLRRVVDGLPGLRVRGFLTEEIRSGGRRVGFRLVALDDAGEGDDADGAGHAADGDDRGKSGDGRSSEAVMAHVELPKRHRVSKYGVDVDAVDAFAETHLALDDRADLHVVDEIGKMECFSRVFVQRMRALLDSDRPLLATIARRGGGFIAAVKRRPDVELLEVTRSNRDALVDDLVAWAERTTDDA